MRKLITCITLATLIVTVGCAGLYTSVVTITKIRHSLMNELGQLYRDGKISAETDAKIAAADDIYLKAANACEKSLIAYQNGVGTELDYNKSLIALKSAVTGLLEIIGPFLTEAKTTDYNKQIILAQKL